MIGEIERTGTAPDGGDGEGRPTPHFRIVIIGTGFSGLGMAIRLKQRGVKDFVVLERAADVGGTWRDNTYPGCQCDVPSNLYSFSFAPNPGWSRTFSRQAEIWEYLRACAERYGVMSHIRFDHAVTGSAWDEEGQRWLVETAQGPITAQVLISGMGGLSDASVPDINGLDSFKGTTFHSAEWDHDHDLAGERVAVIGTGASSIQFVPRIRRKVDKLYLFQRTPPWIMPHRDRPVSGPERMLYKAVPGAQQLVRKAIYWGREAFVPFFMYRPLSRVPERIARAHLQVQVRDPELRAKLTPDYTIGCKRILLSNDYYPALSKPNVEVVTDGIREVKAHSIVTNDGEERQVDTIIFGTGFHVTDPRSAEHIRGRDGRTMAEASGGSPQAYRGTTIAGLPNFFILLGPNTGLGHTSIVVMIEAQIAYVLDCLSMMEKEGIASVEVRPEAQAAFNKKVQAHLQGSVWNTGGCSSWYIDATGKNTTIWPGSTWPFRRLTRRFDPAEYELRPGKPARTTAAA